MGAYGSVQVPDPNLQQQVTFPKTCAISTVTPLVRVKTASTTSLSTSVNHHIRSNRICCMQSITAVAAVLVAVAEAGVAVARA